ncbi:5'/3'-nucleotidase SurE [Candidatus Ruminimicrobium bovinum]|uniref:5'/3'-nucleotidase SurE n=1 Tax=Candidatus Ruminimicrobium bovinum TaxID=3242779 RepID=UPI0039B828E4
MKKYNILISNDDGIKGDGLKSLIKNIAKHANVYVVVPKHEMSGMSQSIHLKKYLKLEKVKNNIFTLEGGTPTDCVKYALYSFFKDKIDLVISGINNCANLAQDVVYSGTVAAAREGAYLGIPSIAVSITDESKNYYEYAAQATLKIALQVLKNEKKGRPAVCLNINIPPNFKGIKIAPLGIRCYDETIVEKKTKKGSYYKLAGRFISGKKNKNSDIDAVEQGYISVTPLNLDQTHFDKIKNYKKILFDKIL